MRATRITMIFAAVVAWQSFPSVAEDRVEEWYVYQQNDTSYASQQTVRKTRQDGNVEFQLNVRVLTDLLGARQETKTETTYVVKPDFQPVSIRSMTMRSSGKVTLSGKREQKKFSLQKDFVDLQRSAVIDLKQTVIFRGLLPYYLIHFDRDRQQSSGSDVIVRLIDEESLDVVTATCQKTESTDATTRWKIQYDGNIGDLIVKHGERFQEQFDAPRFSMIRSTREKADQIVHLELKGPNVLMFDVDKPIARPDRLKEMTVKLSWRGVPLESFQLQDGRQSLQSHSAKDDHHEAELRIAIGQQAAGRSETLDARQIEPLLAPSRFIDPKPPEIVSAAKEWTGDEQDPLKAIQKLADRVSEHLVEGGIVAETLSGPEVLACGKGKCSEYSTLFASLARSIGIPTRIVLGEKMVGDQWIGHMWNEVFIEDSSNLKTERPRGSRTGRWVTVDATTRSVGDAMDLLKFTHSPTVNGTQPLRWAITDSLAISVADFVLLPDDSKEQWTTGVVANTYTNANYGFRLTVPNADWRIEKSKSFPLVVRLKVPDQGKVLIHCVAVPFPLGAKAMLSIRNARFATTYKDYKVLRNEPESISGKPWQTLQFTHRVERKDKQAKPAKKTLKVTEYALQNGEIGYLINLIAEESAHDKNLVAFKQIIESVETR